MNKSIIIIFAIMLASTMTFADEYKEQYQKPTVKRFYKKNVYKNTNSNNHREQYQKPTVKRFYKKNVYKNTNSNNHREQYQKPTVKRFYKTDTYKNTNNNNYRQQYQKPVVKHSDTYKRTNNNNYRQQYQRPIVKHSYKTDTYKRTNNNNYRQQYQRPIITHSYNEDGFYTPVAKTNVFSLQFSKFSHAEQQRIVSFFQSSTWGASIRKNYFTDSLIVQIKSTWNSQTIFRSLQRELSLRGIDLSISHTSGYNAFFVPVQQEYCD